MIAQVDPITFGRNLYLLIGLALLLGLLAVVGVVVWTGMKIWYWSKAKDRAQRELYEKTHRADGERYPSYMVGICDRCGLTNKKIYFPSDGPPLCPPCYETFWRESASHPDSDLEPVTEAETIPPATNEQQRET